MLIGVPGSGKSTWIANQPFDWARTVIASTDGYIDQKATELNSTYSAVFKDHIKDATASMRESVQHAVNHGLDIVWDQTNTTAKARRAKLAPFPPTYKKVAIVFTTPEAKEHAVRLASRPGKHIPDNVIADMIAGMEMPTAAEGFDRLLVLLYNTA